LPYRAVCLISALLLYLFLTYDCVMLVLPSFLHMYVLRGTKSNTA
jgi:hypothetical protein